MPGECSHSEPKSLLLRLTHHLEPLRLAALVFDREIARDRIRADIERMTLAVLAVGQHAQLVGRAVELRLVVDDDCRAGIFRQLRLPPHRGEILVEMFDVVWEVELGAPE